MAPRFKLLAVVAFAMVTMTLAKKDLEEPSGVMSWGSWAAWALLIVLGAVWYAGCACGWRCRAWWETTTSKVLKDNETQSKEVGLREDVKLRDGLAARFTQRCMKCGEPIRLGDWIDNYSRGWCHKACKFRDVV